jgi:hypothetical protein
MFDQRAITTIRRETHFAADMVEEEAGGMVGADRQELEGAASEAEAAASVEEARPAVGKYDFRN